LCRTPRRLRDLSKITSCSMVEPHHHIKIIKHKYHQKLHREKVLAPPVGSSPLLRWAQGHYWYPTDQVPLCTRLKNQPHGSRSVPGARRLWLYHVPRGTKHATRQKRALVSPCTPWHRACHPPGKGSGVTTCPEAPCAPLTRRGLWCCHVPRGTEPIT
jgi:hypothetical protein